jgi:hypothetical protein
MDSLMRRMRRLARLDRPESGTIAKILTIAHRPLYVKTFIILILIFEKEFNVLSRSIQDLS